MPNRPSAEPGTARTMTGASQQPERRRASAGWRTGMQEASPYLGLGMQLALSMLFFVGVGYALDEWLGTTPWLLVAGAVLGMAALFIQLFRITTTLSQKAAGSDKPEDPGEEQPSG